MANNVFNFCGRISLSKETDKFKPIERKEFASSWMNTTVKFNVISDTNRVPVTTQGGKWKDDGRNVIKTFSKSTADTKGTMIDIPWAKRFDTDQIDKVAGFRKFTVDLGDVSMRYKLQDVVDGKRGIDEDMINAGITTTESAAEALKKSKEKKKEFLSEYDFAEYVAKLVTSDKYKDKLFYVSGNYEVQYNAEKDTFYKNYHVNRIVLAPDNAEQNTILKVDFLFNGNNFDNSRYEETGRAYIDGWVTYYDSNVKANGFAPITVAIKETEKKISALKRKFECEDDEIKQIGLTLSVIDGAETIELTMDMLDDETRGDIEAGLLEWEKVKKELGGRAVGDRIRELRFVELTARKNVAQDTVYTVSDMHAARAKEEVIDIFAEDESDDDEL